MPVEPIVERLRLEVIEPLKTRFVGRDEVVDLIALAIVAGEHLFLLGPPGTAKSAIIRQFAVSVQSRYFEYLLTRFSEPNEVFGPIDLVRLREGIVATVTTGMLPEAEFAFLDELFNANSAILNNLLSVLNERTYRRGSEVHHLPLLSLFSASNSLPEDEALRALFDRFLIRCHVKNLPRESSVALLMAGWELERSTPMQSTISAEELRQLSTQVGQVDITQIVARYADVMARIRDLGISLSDRRAVKAMKLVAASALLCGRSVAHIADLWVLRYLWDRQEQIDPLHALITKVLDEPVGDLVVHPLSKMVQVDGETLARQLAELETQIAGKPRSLASLAQLRDRAASIADQAAWLGDEALRERIMTRVGPILEQLG